AGHLVEQGVNDLAVVQVDLARERAVGEMEHTGLPADADELDDVGEVKLGERSLEGHGSELNLAAPANCGREATKAARGCQGQAGSGGGRLLRLVGFAHRAPLPLALAGEQ